MAYRCILWLKNECDGCGACSCVCPAGREVMHEVLRAQETGGTVFLNWGGDALE